jgi:hypothetical protein
MRILKSSALLVCAAIMLSIAACKKDEATTPTQNNTTPQDSEILSSYIKLGETYIIGAQAKAVVYAETQVTTGYTKLHVAMYDSTTNNRLDDGHLHVIPMMEMGMMQHSAPVENELSSTPTAKIWKPSIIFTMSGAWKLKLEFHNHLIDKEGEGELNITVAAPTSPNVKTVSLPGDDSSKVFVTLIQPTSPKIGLNDFEIALHKMADMMTFPAVNNYTVEIDPTMPSMGHGSPNNINPVLTTNGHYKGIVNFTMSGLWRVKLTLKKDGTVLDNSTSFDIIF